MCVFFFRALSWFEVSPFFQPAFGFSFHTFYPARSLSFFLHTPQVADCLDPLLVTDIALKDDVGLNKKQIQRFRVVVAAAKGMPLPSEVTPTPTASVNNLRQSGSFSSSATVNDEQAAANLKAALEEARATVAREAEEAAQREAEERAVAEAIASRGAPKRIEEEEPATAANAPDLTLRAPSAHTIMHLKVIYVLEYNDAP